MAEAHRGDIFRARLSPPGAQEESITVVVVSRDAFNAASPMVLIAPAVSSQDVPASNYPTHVFLSKAAANLDQDLVIVAEQIRPLAKERLEQPLGRVPQQSLGRLNAALRAVLDLT
jgi:mRNA interferase MazF